jgi:lysyl-tRNA synthetase, class II
VSAICPSEQTCLVLTLYAGLAGCPHRTETGQLSLLASKMPLIVSPSLNQIPTELEDQEKMSRQRHVDMIVNPRARDILRVRHAVIRAIRNFWESKSFTEVSTPLIAGDAGGAIARPFETRANDFSKIPLSLRIAPELYLKRLVVGNMPRVFEIGQAFRNEGMCQFLCFPVHFQ